jgi:hypothetical protein
MRSALLRPSLPFLAVVSLAAGCGSSSSTSSRSTPTVAPAKTQREWLDRLVNRFLRPMNQNLRVVNGLATPQGRLFIQTGNQQSIQVVKNRMTDLSHCSDRLDRVGPPPDTKAPLDRVNESFSKACPYYERLARSILKAVPLLSSGDPADQTKGVEEFSKAGAPSRTAARYFGEGVTTLEKNGLLAPYEGP